LFLQSHNFEESSRECNFFWLLTMFLSVAQMEFNLPLCGLVWISRRCMGCGAGLWVKQSSRLNMWSHPDAVASSVHQQQEMQWAKERPIVKKICHLFFFSWYIISEDHLKVNCDQSASL
jgi:hypothetical protein